MSRNEWVTHRVWNAVTHCHKRNNNGRRNRSVCRQGSSTASRLHRPSPCASHRQVRNNTWRRLSPGMPLHYEPVRKQHARNW